MKIQVKSLFKNYIQGGQSLSILKGLDLEVFPGESIAILGQSGSGKSTLLSLLAGLDSADSGHIFFDNKDLSRMSEDEKTKFRSRNISIVFQSYHLVPHLTALENVMLPIEILGESKSEKRAAEILQQVGLSARSRHFSSQLSGGECQRVAIARALVTAPRLLLADEPSGQLDYDTGKSVMDLFFEMIKKYKITTVLVTHDAELAKRCDRQLNLIRGELIANGLKQ